MTTADPLSASGLLVVEGRNDEHLILHLCRRSDRQLASRFSVHDAQGINGVLDTVRGYVNQDSTTSVGFIVDADDDSIGHWNHIMARIAAANDEIQLPQNPDPDGTIIPEDPAIGSPRIGIWVMPDNTSTGELEDFVRHMIPGDDTVWTRAQDYINNIPADARRFDNDAITKNQVHAWLAARRHPGLIGLAVRDGDLNPDGRLPQTFLRWLSRLFA